MMGPRGHSTEKNDKNDVIHRGPYTSAHVFFLNLLNELGRGDKMR